MRASNMQTFELFRFEGNKARLTSWLAKRTTCSESSPTKQCSAFCECNPALIKSWSATYVNLHVVSAKLSNGQWLLECAFLCTLCMCHVLVFHRNMAKMHGIAALLDVANVLPFDFSSKTHTKKALHRLECFQWIWPARFSVFLLHLPIVLSVFVYVSSCHCPLEISCHWFNVWM